jgi:hypothetical protein
LARAAPTNARVPAIHSARPQLSLSGLVSGAARGRAHRSLEVNAGLELRSSLQRITSETDYSTGESMNIDRGSWRDSGSAHTADNT